MALYMGDRKIAGGGSVSAAAWGRITGDIQSQADLAAALREKSDVGHNHDERYALKGEGGNGGLMPAVVGSIVPYMGTDLPEGYLMCDGSEVSKAAYSELYAVVGDRFGTTSDTSKFKLPKIDDARYLQGSDTPGTVVNAGLPNISGEIMFKWSGMYESEGDNNALSSSDSVSECGGGAGNSNRKLTLNASKCNSVYGNSDTVTPFSITVRYLICYKKVIGKVDAMIGMPDYTKGYEIDYNWIAIESGWVFYRAGGNGTFILKVNGIQIFAAYRDAGVDSSHVGNVGFPISKGDILEYSRSGGI